MINIIKEIRKGRIDVIVDRDGKNDYKYVSASFKINHGNYYAMRNGSIISFDMIRECIDSVILGVKENGLFDIFDIYLTIGVDSSLKEFKEQDIYHYVCQKIEEES